MTSIRISDVSEPQVDFLSITSPLDYLDGLVASVAPVLCGAGASGSGPGLWRFDDGGVAMLHRRYSVAYLSLSGSALQRLRDRGSMLELLSIYSDVPHKVTRLDICLDVPLPAPPILNRLYKRGKGGKLRLTREAIPPSQVSMISRPSTLAPGTDTGTVYLGSRVRDVRLMVYDKRNERLSHYAKAQNVTAAMLPMLDPGPLTRFELKLARHVGMTLRDVCEPSAAFWHHMPRSILSPATEPPAWKPHAEGFTLEKVEMSDFERAVKMVENMPDTAVLGRLLKSCTGEENRFVVGKFARLVSPFALTVGLRQPAQPPADGAPSPSADPSAPAPSAKPQ